MQTDLEKAIARLEEELNRVLSILDRAAKGETSALRHLQGLTYRSALDRDSLVIDMPHMVSWAINCAVIEQLPNRAEIELRKRESNDHTTK